MADPIYTPTYDYFLPGAYSNWLWDSLEPYLEWHSGTTICHRDDLTEILDALQPNGWPDLDVILTIIQAIKPQDLKQIHQHSEKEAPILGTAKKFIDWLQLLPNEFKTGKNRIQLIQNLSLLIPFEISPIHALVLLDQFAAGNFDPLLKNNIAPTKGKLNSVNTALVNIYESFQDFEQFKTKVQIGMHEIPKPIDEVEFPPSKASELLDTLEEDSITSGLAAIAKHLLAVLNIPMQSMGKNDMPLGGVSDISNRGNFDRLLLTELAQDDQTLSARLANNEALYLRREEPPQNAENPRIVILENTLRTWGTTYPFIVSTALVCQVTRPKESNFSAFSVDQRGFTEHSLTTKQGIIKLLQTQSNDSTCQNGLMLCLNALGNTGMEKIFICGIDSMQNQTFASKLITLQEQLNYIIALGRTGEIELHQIVKGRRKLLKSARIDVQALLFKSRKISAAQIIKQIADTTFTQPIFAAKPISPLRFPFYENSIKKRANWKLNSNCFLIITQDRRLLLWDNRKYAARELFRDIPKGIVLLEGVQDSSISFFLNPENQELSKRVYFYDLKTDESIIHELPQKAAIYHNFFCSDEIMGWQESIRGQNVLKHIFNTRTGETFSQNLSQTTGLTNEISISASNNKEIQNHDREFINKGYSTLLSVKKIGVDEINRLMMNGFSLNLTIYNGNQSFEWVMDKKKPITKYLLRFDTNQKYPIDGAKGTYPFFRFSKTTNGTQICIDRRGFIHLKSKNPKLAEVTIVTAIGKPTAVWASDGTYSGDPYFIGPDAQNFLSPKEFSQYYIQPIIDEIIEG